MKKTLLCAAVVAMTLAACSKNETTEILDVSNDSKSINFATSTGTTRTGNNAVIDDLQNGGFEVFAMKSAKDAPALLFNKPDGSSSSHSNFYKYTGGNWGWEYQTADKKWPTTDAAFPLQFFAVHPSTSTIATLWDANYDETNLAQQDWTLKVGKENENCALQIEETVATQKDFLVAMSALVDRTPTNAKTNLLFKHIMSNINFAIVTPEGFKIYIHDLKIKNVGGVKDDGLYRVFDADAKKRGVWEESDVVDRAVSYSYFSKIANIKAEVTGASGAAPVAIYSDNTDEDTKKISPKLMPQAKTSKWDKSTFETIYNAWANGTADKDSYETDVIEKMKGAYIELVYAMVDNKGTSLVGKVQNTKLLNGQDYTGNTRLVRVAFPLNFDVNAAGTPWEMSKKYTYNIRLGMPDSSNGTVTDPDYKGEDGSDKPDEDLDNPAVTPGEDVTDTDRLIDFTVDVEAWTDAGSSDIK